MSLIPSESASFSDLLGRGLGASRKSSWRMPGTEDEEDGSFNAVGKGGDPYKVLATEVGFQEPVPALPKGPLVNRLQAKPIPKPVSEAPKAAPAPLKPEPPRPSRIVTLAPAANGIIAPPSLIAAQPPLPPVEKKKSITPAVPSPKPVSTAPAPKMVLKTPAAPVVAKPAVAPVDHANGSKNSGPPAELASATGPVPTQPPAAKLSVEVPALEQTLEVAAEKPSLPPAAAKPSLTPSSKPVPPVISVKPAPLKLSANASPVNVPAKPAAPQVPVQTAPVPEKPAVPTSINGAAANDFILKILQANSPPPSNEPYRFAQTYAPKPAPPPPEPAPSYPTESFDHEPDDPLLADLFAPRRQRPAPAPLEQIAVLNGSATVEPLHPTPEPVLTEPSPEALLSQIFSSAQPVVEAPLPGVPPAAAAPLLDEVLPLAVEPDPSPAPAPVQPFISPQPTPQIPPAQVSFAPPAPESEPEEPVYRPIPIVRRARSAQNPKGEPAPRPQPLMPVRSAVPAAPHQVEGRVRPNVALKPRAEEAATPELPPKPPLPAVAAHNGHPAAVQQEPANPSEFIEPNDEWQEEEWLPPARIRRRRSFNLDWNSRFVRFMTYEVAALLVLIISAVLGIRHRLPEDPLSTVTKLLLIAAAVVAAIIPVIFYGLPDRLPRDDR